jgi:hypothetical protein
MRCNRFAVKTSFKQSVAEAVAAFAGMRKSGFIRILANAAAAFRMTVMVHPRSGRPAFWRM